MKRLLIAALALLLPAAAHAQFRGPDQKPANNRTNATSISITTPGSPLQIICQPNKVHTIYNLSIASSLTVNFGGASTCQPNQFIEIEYKQTAGSLAITYTGTTVLWLKACTSTSCVQPTLSGSGKIDWFQFRYDSLSGQMIEIGQSLNVPNAVVPGNTLAAHNFANSISGAGVLSGTQLSSADLSDVPLASSALANTAVTPGSYTATNLTVNAQGQITAASNGSATVGFVHTPTVTAGAVTLQSSCGSAGCTDENDITAPASGTLAITTDTAAHMIAGETIPVVITFTGSTVSAVTWTVGSGVAFKSFITGDASANASDSGGYPCPVPPATGRLLYTAWFDGTRFTFAGCVPDPPGANLGVQGGGLGLSSGTSGGVPAFTGSTTIASSAALTANLPVIGGGPGAVPSVGTRSGNTTKFMTGSGAFTNTHAAGFDANGNVVDIGAAGAGGGGIGGSTANTPGGDSVINVKNYGALEDEQACSVNNSAGCTHGGAMDNNVTAILTDTSDTPFVSGDVGKLICVDASSATTDIGGVKSETCGTIVTFTDSSHVVLSFKNTSGGAITAKDFYWATDDTTALQNALNAAQTLGGGIVWMPKGCSGLATGLTMPTAASVTFTGIGSRAYTGSPNPNRPGSCLRWYTKTLAGAAFGLVGPTNNTNINYYYRLANMSLYGGTGGHYDGGGHDGIKVFNWGNLVIERVDVAGFTSNGLLIDSGDLGAGNNYSILITTRDSRFERNGNDGISLGGSSGAFLQNITVNGTESTANGRAGLYVSSSITFGVNGLFIGDESLLQFNNVLNTNPGYEFWNAGVAGGSGVQGGAIVGAHFESDHNNTSSLLLGAHAGFQICGNFFQVNEFGSSGGSLPAGGLAFCQTS